MTLTQVILAVGVVSTGMFTGLVAAMLMIVAPMFDQLGADQYTEIMQRFLGVARRAPLNIVLILTSVIAPFVALLFMLDRIGDFAFWLTFLGLLIFFTGAFLVSNRINEPLYDWIQAWRTPPDNWQQARIWWNQLNVIRASASGMAFVFLLLALILL